MTSVCSLSLFFRPEQSSVDHKWIIHNPQILGPIFPKPTNESYTQKDYVQAATPIIVGHQGAMRKYEKEEYSSMLTMTSRSFMQFIALYGNLKQHRRFFIIALLHYP